MMLGKRRRQEPGPRLSSINTGRGQRDSYNNDGTVVRQSCLVPPGVRDKRRVSEIELSQPRHGTAFW